MGFVILLSLGSTRLTFAGGRYTVPLSIYTACHLLRTSQDKAKFTEETDFIAVVECCFCSQHHLTCTGTDIGASLYWKRYHIGTVKLGWFFVCVCVCACVMMTMVVMT